MTATAREMTAEGLLRLERLHYSWSDVRMFDPHAQPGGVLLRNPSTHGTVAEVFG